MCESLASIWLFTVHADQIALDYAALATERPHALEKLLMRAAAHIYENVMMSF